MDRHVERAFEILERTPHVLGALLSGISRGWAEGDAGAGTWSPRDVVGHLVHNEQEDWIPRIERLLKHGEELPFEPFDPEGFRAMMRGMGLDERLKLFASMREESVAALRAMALEAQDLERTGTHPAFGRVTLKELVATWAVHDLGHLAQIARTMAKQWKDEIGPWREYLPVVDR